jgi:hypothetical protein
MPVDLNGTLRQALGKLEAEKARIDRQIAGLRQALNAGVGTTDGTGVRRTRTSVAGRKGMSPAARKAASVRMKAYWAKRRSARGKSKGKAA